MTAPTRRQLLVASLAASGTATVPTIAIASDPERLPNAVQELRTLATKASLQTAKIPIIIDAIRLLGYSSAGDMGDAMYQRVASEPSHPGKIQSSDGAWWEIASVVLVPEMFGVDGVALQAVADVSKALRRPIVGQGEYLIDSAVDFTEAVIDFSAATIKLADNFAPPVAITLGQPDGTTAATKGRYSADLFIDGNKANQSGTPVAVLIEDLITPSNRFVIRGVDCNTLCKIHGAAEYISVDIHADRCGLACHLTEKTVDPLGDSTPDDILINIYGHSCNSYFKADGAQHITAKVNIFSEQGGGNSGDIAINLASALGQYTVGGVIRAFNGDVGVYANLTDNRSQVMFDHLQIDSGSGTYAVHIESAGVVSGFVSMRASRGMCLQSVLGAVNLSVVSNQAQQSPIVRVGSGAGSSVMCGILNLTCADYATMIPLKIDELNPGATDMDSALRGVIVNLQTDGSGLPAAISSTVTGVLTLHLTNCRVDWRGEVTFDSLKKDTSGMTASVEIADDTFIAFTPPHTAGRIMVREKNQARFYTGMFEVDTSPVNTELHSHDSHNGTTGALIGTTGTDGNVTVSAHTDGKIYIENRRGAAIRFWIIID